MDQSTSSLFSPVQETNLRDCLVCYLCGDVYRRPRILPCGHTFCSECLARVKDELLEEGKQSYTYALSEQSSRLNDKRDTSLDTSIKDKSNGHVPNGTSADPTAVTDETVSCYRPQKTSSAPRPVSAPSGLQTVSLQRSRTFNTHKTLYVERSPSRFSAPAGIPPESPTCSHCGSISTDVPGSSRRTKSLNRSPNRNVTSPHSERASSMPRWESSAKQMSASHFSAPACSFEHRHGREMGQFVCPLPECGYSLRLMNLARWSPRNRTVADVIAVWRRQQEDKKDASTQTDVSLHESLLVSIPRSLFDAGALSPLGPRRRHSSMVDMALSHAISMDNLEGGYIPRGVSRWKTYAAMVGMNILQQLANL